MKKGMLKAQESWKKIWNKREPLIYNGSGYSCRELVLKLKELNGFDVVDGSLTYESFINQYTRTKNELMYDSCSMGLKSIESIFEVGCGSGANLYLFGKDGTKVGGIDYSSTLIEVARSVLAEWGEELICDEAINIPLDIKYDCVLSNSVFSYFPDFEYAREVLKKMLKKCTRNIGILDIHYDEKKEDFINYRRKIIPDYDKKYENLGKLFYSKDFLLILRRKIVWI